MDKWRKTLKVATVADRYTVAVIVAFQVAVTLRDVYFCWFQRGRWEWDTTEDSSSSWHAWAGQYSVVTQTRMHNVLTAVFCRPGLDGFPSDLHSPLVQMYKWFKCASLRGGPKLFIHFNTTTGFFQTPWVWGIAGIRELCKESGGCWKLFAA